MKSDLGRRSFSIQGPDVRLHRRMRITWKNALVCLVLVTNVCSIIYLMRYRGVPLFIACRGPVGATQQVSTSVLRDWEAPAGGNTNGQELTNSGGDTTHSGSSSPPLLTLFSTWAEDKDLARNLTMANWAKLGPAVLPVLFTNISVQAARARSYGWHTLPVTRTAVDVPVLKYMYLDAMKRFNTTFVGFANGDILFTNGLLDSLHAIIANSTLPWRQKHLLVVGMRTNVANVTAEETLTFKDVAAVARERGEISTPNGVDFFITDRNYPWDKIPEVVVGRLNYDSFLVLNAVKSGHMAIDATKTVLAVHQTTEAGIRENLAHPNRLYNNYMLRKIYKRINFLHGRADCALWETLRDTEGQVIVQQTTPNPEYC